MRKIAPRVYEVVPKDFPIEVEVKAVNLAANRAIVGELRIETGGVVVARIQPPLKENQANRTITYDVDQPPAPPVNISQIVDGFFDAGAPLNARYEITITAAAGDIQKTAIRTPSINPGTARLTFVFV